MTTAITNRKPTSVARGFRTNVEGLARNMLAEILGSKEGRQAAAQVGLAFGAAVRSAKDPSALYKCSPESVGSAVAMSALTQLMPGGPAPAVWLVPKGGELQWWLSHRGIATLCLRAGYQVLPVPVHINDHFVVSFGEVEEHEPNDWPESLGELAGVYVTVRKLSDGLVLCRPWVPQGAIMRRRKGAGPVWNAWPIEMAQKTAIRWCLSRGLLPIQGMEINLALGAEPDQTADRVKVEVETSVSDAPASALGSPPPRTIETAPEPPSAPQAAPDPEPEQSERDRLKADLDATLRAMEDAEGFLASEGIDPKRSVSSWRHSDEALMGILQRAKAWQPELEAEPEPEPENTAELSRGAVIESIIYHEAETLLGDREAIDKARHRCGIERGPTPALLKHPVEKLAEYVRHLEGMEG